MNIRLVLAAAALTLPAAAQAAVINLSSIDNASLDGTNAVVRGFQAGTYKLSFTADQFTSFTRFSGVSGCNASGFSCAQGFETSARYIIDGATFTFGDRNAEGGLGAQGETYYETAALAFAAAQSYSATFTLAQAQEVSFFIYDDFLGDNSGGVSLSVTAVPEPATWALMIGGFGLVGGAMRRRVRASVAFA